jgi:hypothetical protein
MPSKTFRSLVATAVFAALGLGLMLAGTTSTVVAAAAPAVETTNISLVNVGTATAGSTVNIICYVQVTAPPAGTPPYFISSVELGFDQNGNPSTKTGAMAPYWSANGSSWQSVGAASTEFGSQVCAHTMINNGGAASTSWTCDYISVPAAPVGDGCIAPSGADRGPVGLNWALATDGLTSETVNMVFTNTYADPIAPIAPSFTG